MIRIVEVLNEKDGIALARADNGQYLVGIGYYRDQNIAKLNNWVDFVQTKSLEIAVHQFNLKTGEKA